MSVFQPIDPRAALDRRKRLLARLNQTGQSIAGRLSLPGEGHAVKSAAGLVAGPRPQITRPPLPNALLAALLGPGGASRPIPGEYSPTPGAPITPPGVGAAPPGIGSPLTPPGPPAPIPPLGSVNPPPGPHLGGDVLPSGAGAPIAPVGEPIGSPSSASPPFGGNLQPVPSSTAVASITGGVTPLGNGLYYDPATDTVIDPSVLDTVGGGNGLFSKAV